MSNPNFVLLYVDNPSVSVSFYAGLLDRQPVEASATFALFALDSGLMLGLWSRHTVEPAARNWHSQYRTWKQPMPNGPGVAYRYSRNPPTWASDERSSHWTPTVID
jgi:hypothetical protein